MASVRLNELLRSDIRRRALQGAFTGEQATLVAKQAAFALKLYRAFVPEDVEQAANKAPQDFVQRSDEIRATVTNQKSDDFRRHLYARFTLEKERPIPARMAYNHDFGTVDNLSLFNELEALNEEYRVISTKLEDLRHKVRNVINSVTTVQRLREVWPEVEQFLPREAFEAAPTKGVPALLVKDLTEQLAAAGVEFKKAA